MIEGEDILPNSITRLIVKENVIFRRPPRHFAELRKTGDQSTECQRDDTQEGIVAACNRFSALLLWQRKCFQNLRRLEEESTAVIRRIYETQFHRIHLSGHERNRR